GVLLQVNAESLLSPPRRSDSDRLGRHLCTEGLAHALASDGHRAAGWRPVGCMADAMPTAVALVGAERAYWMMGMAPAAIVAGDELPPAPRVRIGRQRPRLLRRGGEKVSYRYIWRADAGAWGDGSPSRVRVEVDRA